MPSDAWYLEPETLLGELRGEHRERFPPPSVPGYVDLAFLQRGGQGSVYSAREVAGDRLVALKVFHPESGSLAETRSARRRFEREMELVARLGHPNVVRLHRFGRTPEGLCFLAMEFLHGVPWSEYAQQADDSEILGLGVQLAGALGHAHRRGVIHRDLKPGNVIVDAGGHARLIDFGMAKPARRVRARDGFELSVSGQFLGTLAWASPEQLKGHPDDVDTRTDIYSLGLLLYHGFTGELPYAVDGSVADVVESIERRPARALRSLRPELSSDLETLLLNCLAKDPARRYPSMEALARDLGHVLAGEPIEARRDGVLQLLSQLLRRHPWTSTLAGLALIALAALAGISSFYYIQAKDAAQAEHSALLEKEAEVQRVAKVNEFLLGTFIGQAPPGRPLDEVRLKDVLAGGAQGIETDPSLARDSEVRADLHVAFAYWFAALPGQWERALEHANLALELYAEDDEPNPVQVAWALEVRGGVALGRGEFEQAEADLLESLGRYSALAPVDFNQARVLGQLASCAFGIQDLEAAADYLGRCRGVLVELFGDSDPRVASIASALAPLP